MVSRISFLDLVRPGRNNDRQVSTTDPLPVALYGAGGAGAPPAGTNADAQYIKGSMVTTTDDVAGAVNAVATNLAAVDAKDFQSVALQITVLSTYTGQVNFEVSNDGVNWTTKLLANSGSGTVSSSATAAAQAVGQWNLFSGDIGARYFRVRQVSWTAGQVRIVAILDALSTATIPAQTSSLVLNTSTALIGAVSVGHTSDTSNSAALGAGATYTGAVVDQGAVDRGQSTRVRGVIRHQAGLIHGHVVFYESSDNATFVETARMPAPSDGLYHQFEFASSMRYYRVDFVNGTTAQTLFLIRHYRVGVEGESPVGRQVLAFPLSRTALGISGVFTSSSMDLGPTHKWSTIRASVVADQAGSLAVQQSDDNATWTLTRPSDVGVGGAVAAGALTVAAGGNEFAEAKIVKRYVRLVYTNGGVAQGSFRLDAALVNL